MATLHVRNVPDPLYEALRERAEASGRSIGGETVRIIEEALVAEHVEATAGTRRRRFRRSRHRTTAPFERFTERARQVIVLAQEEARGLRHNYIGTEHLLLGLLRVEDGLAARALASLGVAAEDVRERVRDVVGEGTEEPVAPTPFTPRAKKVLELALREALSLGADHVGTEHLLLGLAREEEGVAARILLDLGAGAETIRTAIVRIRTLPPPPGSRFPLERRPARARSEYRVVELAGDADSWAGGLNTAADEGWELFEVVAAEAGAKAVFRRHLE